MKIYGLTGGIATGKSAVAAILNTELHVNIIDADLLAREAVEPGSTGLMGIIESFGKDILLGDQSLDRTKLGSVVFKDKKSIKILNQIIHPEVNQLFNKSVEMYREQGCKAIIYDCPLLVEENLIDRVDEVILVITSENLQLQRLINRNNFTYEEATLRIQAQMKMEEKISYADYIVYNDGDFDELKAAIFHLWTQIIEKEHKEQDVKLVARAQREVCLK